MPAPINAPVTLLPEIDLLALPVVSVRAADALAAETLAGQPVDRGSFAFTRTGDLSQPLTVAYTIEGTAAAGSDFRALSGTVTFAAGSATATVRLEVLDDALAEGDETVVVRLVDGPAYDLGADSSATVTIRDNDAAPATPVVSIAASDAAAGEAAAGQAADPGVFTLTRTGDLSQALTVTYTVEGTATGGADYAGLTGTVTFAPGSATATVRVDVIDDAAFEGSETVVLRLTDGTAYDLGASSSATITIADNETAPVVTVRATDAVAAETLAGQPVNRGSFAFTRTGDLSQPLTVSYTVEGTATAGSDYKALSGTVTFAAGSATATVRLDAIDDALFEGDETVVVRLVDGPAYDVGAGASATVTIRDNDAAPATPVVSIAASDAAAGETAAGQAANPGIFTLTRTGDLSQALTVTYTVEGTATGGADYAGLTGTVTFAPGSATATVRVDVTDDAAFEGSETVVLRLTDGAAYDLGAASSATVTIADNETAPVVTVRAADAVAAETLAGQSVNRGSFAFSRTGDLSQPLTVTYVVEGTATAGSDYKALTGTVTFAAGSATATVRLDVIDDALFEGSETVIVRLTDGTAYDLGAASSATVTIADNDTIPVVTVQATDAAAGEAGAGQAANPGLFTLTRTGDLSQALTVTYTVEGTATAGADYAGLIGTVTFAPGSATATVRIDVTDDAAFEGSETVVLRLTDGTAYDLGTASSATVTIADNDAPQIVTVFATDGVAAESSAGQVDNDGVFTFTRTGDLSQALTVSYTVRGTATGGVDYVALPGTVTFAAGSATATVRVDVIDDALAEGLEDVTIDLVDGAAYDLGAGRTASVSIGDNDLFPVVTVVASDASAAETAGGQAANPGVFTLTRTGSTAEALTVTYVLQGTATAGGDYAALTGTVTFAAGSATATVRIDPLDDAAVEGSETVVLQLLDGAAYNLGVPQTATVTIADNDTAAVTPVVTVQATDAAAAETGAGQAANPGLFTLTRTGDLSQPLTVTYVVEGTATGGADYAPISGTVTFGPGSATATVRIDVLDDAVFEGNETVTLRLTDGAAYDLGAGQSATVTIGDNDTRPDQPGAWGPTRQFGWSTTDVGEGIAVANGRVFVVGGTETNFGTVRPHPTDFGQNDGTRDGWVGFFDAATGTQAAAFQREAAPIVGPVSSGGALYYGYVNDVLNAVDIDAAGNAVVVGTIAERYMIARNNDPTDPRDNTSQVIENNDIVLAKYDAAGNRLWRVEIEETLGDSAFDVAVARDGTIYVAAHLGEDEYGRPLPFGATLMKFSADGVEDKAWRKSLNDNLTYARHVEIDDSGTVFTAGTFTNRAAFTGEDVYVQRHRADGSTEWLVAAVQTNLKDSITGFDAGQNGVSWAVGVSTDFLAGPQPVDSYWLVRIAANGAVTRFDAPTAGAEQYRFNDVDVSADGFVFVTGLVSSDGGNTVQGFVRKLEADGDFLWEARIGGPGAPAAITEATLDANGDLWVTGLSGGLGGATNGGFDAFFARLDLDGPAPTLAQARGGDLGLSVVMADAFEWAMA